MKRNLILSCLTFAGIAALNVSASNLVVNGDFEAGVGAVDGAWVEFFGGSSFPGWSVGGASVDVHRNHPPAFAPATQHSGAQAVDLAGSGKPGSIFQDLATVPGVKYVVDFYATGHSFHTDPNNFKLFDVLWDGVALTPTAIQIDPPFDFSVWQHFSFEVAAVDTSTTLSFVGHTLNGGAIIDDVSVQAMPGAVPESAHTLVLLGSALGGVIGLRARKLRNDVP